ncbi:VOC family protein [Nocardiopsis sp. RSe5-2]|uniref:VOC family protein n=1 Tax=Nocardiopsis endophytica TaxID=3018445 RepID=A0ABT4UDW2_9ACTN|nr:VOC family protein [Nocardiopsis endophytica]MDA2815108.1 VOC family protein [Nocardiopsis endophytica]
MDGAMPINWQLTVDSADPHEQADFWAEALGYVVEDHDAFIGGLIEQGLLAESDYKVRDGRRVFCKGEGIHHPDDPAERGAPKRRILFLKVPESKQVKNRLHMDLSVGPERREAEVKRLERLGARILARVEEPEGIHVTMADPEGNEFCVQ